MQSEPIYVVRREGCAGVSFSIEYGDFRCHVEGREPGTTRKLRLPDGFHGSLRDAELYYRYREVCA